MSQPEPPEIVELEAVLTPETTTFHISESRHIVVALALFAETATLHTVIVMADSLTEPWLTTSSSAFVMNAVSSTGVWAAATAASVSPSKRMRDSGGRTDTGLSR